MASLRRRGAWREPSLNVPCDLRLVTCDSGLVLSAAFLRGNCVTRRTQKVIQGGDNGHVGRPLNAQCGLNDFYQVPFFISY